jgi:hypothetical protein
MNTTEHMTDWCNSILRGTFGANQAMLMRLAPRYSDLTYFPANFIDTALRKFSLALPAVIFVLPLMPVLLQVCVSYMLCFLYFLAYYNSFIERRKSELRVIVEKDPLDMLSKSQLEFFETEQATLLRQLGSSLSDRADGMHRTYLRQLKRDGQVLPPRTKRAKVTKAPSTPQTPPTVKRKQVTLTMPRSLEK